MNDKANGWDLGSPPAWTKQRIFYEVGFRVALFCVLGALSSVIFFASGAFGGSFDMTAVLLSSAG